MEGNLGGIYDHNQLLRESDDILADRAQILAGILHERGLVYSFLPGSEAVMSAAETSAQDIAETDEPSAEQQPFFFKGYLDTLDAINDGRLSEATIPAAGIEELTSEFKVWFTNDKQSYLQELQSNDPGLMFTLSAAPNVLVEPLNLTYLAESIGKDQPYDTKVFVQLLRQFTAEELCKTDPSNGNKVLFGLFSNKPIPGLEGSVYEQREKLAELQVSKPFMRAPSQLEGLAYMYTLRAHGLNLSRGGKLDIPSYIRHFDLAEKDLGSGLYVPTTYLRSHGGAELGVSPTSESKNSLVVIG